MKIIEKVKMLINSPRIIIRILGNHGCLNFIPDKIYLRLVYWSATGKKLNISEPITYNEKLQWLKLNDRKPEYNIYVDKYAVRSYIAETIGEKYLIPLIGLYNSVDEIDWDTLPNQFVLKCTHGSGSNIICSDKDKLDIEASKIKLNRWMKKNWFWFGREWPYKDVKPRIICEEFISDNDKQPPMDYKILCFNGKAKLIEVHIDRFGKHKQDFYSIDWEKTKISQNMSTSDILLSRPVVLEDMIELSEILAQNTNHVRIDWYLVKNRLFFGEVTFFDGSGFCPFDSENDDLILGNLIDLEAKNCLNEG